MQVDACPQTSPYGRLGKITIKNSGSSPDQWLKILVRGCSLMTGLRSCFKSLSFPLSLVLSPEGRGKLFPLPFGGSTLLTALSLSKGERVRVRGDPNSSKLHSHFFPCFSNSFRKNPCFLNCNVES